MIRIRKFKTDETSSNQTAAISLTSVGHGKNSWTSVGQLEVLISKLVSVDGLSTGTIVVSKVTSLLQAEHESS